jgi:hypothetical protein
MSGSQPTLGMDVHAALRIGRPHLNETTQFLGELSRRLECISNTRSRADCPSNLATGSGTGFALVTEHIPEFKRRGFCARDPNHLLAEGSVMRVPRRPGNGDEFRPYSPASTLPYAHRWRLFRTPNDAFLTADTHREGTPLFDICNRLTPRCTAALCIPRRRRTPSSLITYCVMRAASLTVRKECRRAARASKWTGSYSAACWV